MTSGIYNEPKIFGFQESRLSGYQRQTIHPASCYLSWITSFSSCNCLFTTSELCVETFSLSRREIKDFKIGEGLFDVICVGTYLETNTCVT